MKRFLALAALVSTVGLLGSSRAQAYVYTAADLYFYDDRIQVEGDGDPRSATLGELIALGQVSAPRVFLPQGHQPEPAFSFQAISGDKFGSDYLSSPLAAPASTPANSGFGLVHKPLTPVPEPGTAALGLLGGLLLGARARRR